MKIFLSAPFSSVYNEQKGIVDPKFRERLQKIITLIKKKNHDILSSHLRENWGKNRMHPSEFTLLDIKEIKSCDLVIAYLNSQPSGVYMELGWASAFKKKIIIITEQPLSQLTPLIGGLNRITETIIIKFKDENELLRKLDSVLQTFAV
jgi:nucleoside 2-deoxyribosyltransferase